MAIKHVTDYFSPKLSTFDLINPVYNEIIMGFILDTVSLKISSAILLFTFC